MKLFIFANGEDLETNGCDYHRVLLVARALHIYARDLIHVTLKPVIETLDVVFHNLFYFSRHVPLTKEQLDMFKRLISQRPFVYDLDDNMLEILPENVLPYHFWKANQRNFLYVLEHANILCSPNEELIKFYNSAINQDKPYVVLPNMVDTAFAVDHPTITEPIRIFWQGGSSHVSDLKIISNVMHELPNVVSKKIEYVTMGPAREFMLANLFGDREPQVRWEHYGWLRCSDYYYFIRSLKVHLGIAPLQNNRFSSCKSILKVLDYVYAGALPVMSKVKPYDGCLETLSDEELDKIFIENNDEQKWIENLKFLCENDEFRANLFRKIRKELFEKYNPRTVARKFATDLRLQYQKIK